MRLNAKQKAILAAAEENERRAKIAKAYQKQFDRLIDKIIRDPCISCFSPPGLHIYARQAMPDDYLPEK